MGLKRKSIPDSASVAVAVRRHQLDNFLVSLQLPHQCAFLSGSYWLKSHNLGQSSRTKLTDKIFLTEQAM